MSNYWGLFDEQRVFLHECCVKDGIAKAQEKIASSNSEDHSSKQN
jgi:hypothetical protein